MSDKEIVLDEDSPLDEVLHVLNQTLEQTLEIVENLKVDESVYALHELTLQAIDITLLLQEKIGDVVLELDFDSDDDEAPSKEYMH